MLSPNEIPVEVELDLADHDARTCSCGSTMTPVSLLLDTWVCETIDCPERGELVSLGRDVHTIAAELDAEERWYALNDGWVA